MPPDVEAVLESLTGLQIVIWVGVIFGVGVGIYKAWPVLS